MSSGLPNAKSVLAVAASLAVLMFGFLATAGLFEADATAGPPCTPQLVGTSHCEPPTLVPPVVPTGGFCVGTYDAEFDITVCSDDQVPCNPSPATDQGEDGECDADQDKDDAETECIINGDTVQSGLPHIYDAVCVGPINGNHPELCGCEYKDLGNMGLPPYTLCNCSDS